MANQKFKWTHTDKRLRNLNTGNSVEAKQEGDGF